MRVAYYADAPRFGGAERYLVDLVHGVARAGHETHVLLPASDVVAAIREGVGPDVAVHVLPSSSPTGSTVTHLRRVAHATRILRQRLKVIGPDVVHVSNGGHPGSDYCLAAVMASPVPSVLAVHSLAFERGPHWRRLEPETDWAVWRAAERVLCATKASANALEQRRHLPPAKVTLVPYGVADAETDGKRVSDARQELSPKGEFVVGMVVAPGSDPGYKGCDVLLRALARTERPDLRGAFVGLDPSDAFPELAAAVEDRTSILGRVPDVGPYVAAFDVLAVPSTKFESLPLVILEAMARKTPVIGSRLSGIPEAVVDGETGLVVPPGDVEALSNAIERLAGAPDLVSAMAGNSRARFNSSYTLDLMVQRTLAVYEDVRRKRRN